MRYVCVLVALLLTPLTALAQRHEPRTPSQSQTGPGAIGLPLPAIGLPPLTTRSTGNPQWQRVQPPSWERPQTPWWERQGPPAWEQDHVARPAPTQPHRNPRPRTQVVYVLTPNGNPMGTPWFPSAPQPATAVTAPLVVTARPLTGRLRLDVEPADLLQVFVDGIYVGTRADLGDAIEMPAGARRIEIRAPGYQTLVFDAQIDAERDITYRGALEPVADVRPVTPPPPPPVVPTGSKTIYVIPGCYMGNVSPVEMKLPAGCDISRMTTYTP